MSLDKINLTLYDLFGYLMPGYLMLIGASVAESTWSSTHLLSLSRLVSIPVPYAIAAYFLGQMAHAAGSTLSSWSRTGSTRLESRCNSLAPGSLRCRALKTTLKIVRPAVEKLDPALSKHVAVELRAAYGLRDEELDENSRLATYQLCDSFLSAHKCPGEREVLQAREGFFKASAAAFIACALVFSASLIGPGARVSLTSGNVEKFGWWLSLACALISWLMASICWQRFHFFGRLKRNNAALVFLALRRTLNN
jgi:hypothetical protein